MQLTISIAEDPYFIVVCSFHTTDINFFSTNSTTAHGMVKAIPVKLNTSAGKLN